MCATPEEEGADDDRNAIPRGREEEEEFLCVFSQGRERREGE